MAEEPSFLDILHSQAIIERAHLELRSTVNLSNFKLNTIPLNLTQIKFLLNLYLDKNLLQSLPVEIAQLENLEVLALDYNKLNEFPPILLLLTTLVKINLSYNPLKEIPSQIKELQNLEVLWINNTQISRLPPEIGQLSKLDTLGARCNNIEFIPREILELGSLRWLTLRGNKIKCLPEFTTISNIIHLNLSHNLFEEIPSLSSIKTLKYCYLGDNPLVKIDYKDFCRFKHLKLLQLHKLNVPEEYLMEYPFLKINDPDVEVSTFEQTDNEDSEEDWADSLDTSDINTSEGEDEDDGFNNNWNNHIAMTWLPLIAKLGGCIK
ncbi:uncharacterized protein isoform X1 [Rhodnius prolixus]|uniref:Putative leucine-rich repeat-containing protein n=1 Tax=Rhodnius prolixus TaxID=13249 RepID=R4FJP3_RHOPR